MTLWSKTLAMRFARLTIAMTSSAGLTWPDASILQCRRCKSTSAHRSGVKFALGGYFILEVVSLVDCALIANPRRNVPGCPSTDYIWMGWRGAISGRRRRRYCLPPWNFWELDQMVLVV